MGWLPRRTSPSNFAPFSTPDTHAKSQGLLDANKLYGYTTVPYLYVFTHSDEIGANANDERGAGRHFRTGRMA